MKKIFLTCALAALTIFATEAQTKKSKKSRKAVVSTEAKLNADIAKIQTEKRVAMEQSRMDRMVIDSTRKADELTEEAFKDSSRIAWKEQKLKEVDSTNQVNWKQQMADKDQWYATERSQKEINKAAKLSENQGRQVKAINLSFNAQAKAVKENMELTQDQRMQQLATLNVERRAKIRAAIGKGDESKLEKARRKYMTSNTDDKDSAWLNEIAVVGNK